MNYETGNSWCYDNNPSNCDTYGRLYDWNIALGVCPSGWHLPSDEEWTKLTGYLGGESVAGTKMKSTSDWYNNGNGDNSNGFNALPGGLRYYYGNFYALTHLAYFWSSSQYDAVYAWHRDLEFRDSIVGRYYGDKAGGFSCRCLRD